MQLCSLLAFFKYQGLEIFKLVGSSAEIAKNIPPAAFVEG